MSFSPYRWGRTHSPQRSFPSIVPRPNANAVTTIDKKSDLRWKYQLQVTIAVNTMITDYNAGTLWLHEPCPQLGGRVPLQVATTKRGTAEVLRVLKYWPGPQEGLAHLRTAALP